MTRPKPSRPPRGRPIAPERELTEAEWLQEFDGRPGETLAECLARFSAELDEKLALLGAFDRWPTDDDPAELTSGHSGRG